MLLLIGSAFAQNSTATSQGRDCPNTTAIYGTAGFANEQQALNTNATTYSASAFAERLGLNQPASLSERKARSFVIWEVNNSFDVARVPTYNAPVQEIEQPDCDYLIGNRGADLQATFLGGVFGTPHFGGFFAASQTSGEVASTDNLLRGITFGYLYPLYSTLPLLASPFIQGEVRSGSTAVALDAVYGVWFDNTWVLAKAGYTKSSGFFASARDHTLGAFFTAVVRPSDGSLPVFRAGIQKLDLGESYRDVGMPSVYYRDIPLAQPIPDKNAAPSTQQRLRTAHAGQEDMGRMFDVATSFRIRPEPTVSDASVAIHSRAYNLREGEDRDQPMGFVYVQGGMVELLEQASLGVEGGIYPSARFEVGYRGPGSALWLHLYMNDAEQLALYPFARNALSMQMHVEVTRW